MRQEQSETAYLRQGEYGLDPEIVSGLNSGSELPPKFNGHFLVQGYMCDKIFMKTRSIPPEI